MTAVDTATSPAQQFREMVDGAGFTVSELPEDLTWEQVAELATDLVRKLDAPKAATA